MKKVLILSLFSLLIFADNNETTENKLELTLEQIKPNNITILQEEENPIYIVSKYNAYTTDDKKNGLYFVGKLGSDLKGDISNLKNIDYKKDGLYGAFGIGGKINELYLEAVYEQKYNKEDASENKKYNSIGLNFSINDYNKSELPKIKTINLETKINNSLSIKEIGVLPLSCENNKGCGLDKIKIIQEDLKFNDIVNIKNSIKSISNIRNNETINFITNNINENYKLSDEKIMKLKDKIYTYGKKISNVYGVYNKDVIGKYINGNIENDTNAKVVEIKFKEKND